MTVREGVRKVHITQAKPDTLGRLDLAKVAIHGGFKTKIRTMGWYALAEGGEDLGEVGWMSFSLQINNPYNNFFFPLHLCITIYQYGKGDLNFDNADLSITRSMEWSAF